MAGHDWEALHGALEQATSTWSRTALVGLLEDLIREYVIDRGLPTGTPAQAVTPDLTQMDWPSLMLWLQRVCTVPELGLFTVEGQRVLVDADGLREVSFARATEPRATRAAAPRPATPRPATPRAAAPQPATPQSTLLPDVEPASTPAKKAKPLGQGFRGLEFD